MVNDLLTPVPIWHAHPQSVSWGRSAELRQRRAPKAVVPFRSKFGATISIRVRARHGGRLTSDVGDVPAFANRDAAPPSRQFVNDARS